jgi:hypothetical protein
MAVVPATNLWIDANFKETQLAHMRIGQPATVISDIYGDDEVHRQSGRPGYGHRSASLCCRRRTPPATGSKWFSACRYVSN